MSVLSIENLSYAYPNAETPALNDVSLSVNKGEFVVICGPTGVERQPSVDAYWVSFPIFLAGICLVK